MHCAWDDNLMRAKRSPLAPMLDEKLRTATVLHQPPALANEASKYLI